MTRCTFKRPDGYGCGSYQFNLKRDGIDQGTLCDVHYWQARGEARDAVVKAAQEYLSAAGMTQRALRLHALSAAVAELDKP